MKVPRSVTGYPRARYEFNGNTLSDDGRYVVIPRLEPWGGLTEGWTVPVEDFDRAVDAPDSEDAGAHARRGAA